MDQGEKRRMNDKRKMLSRLKWLGLSLLAAGLILIAGWIMKLNDRSTGNPMIKDIMAKTGSYPSCPADLEGILTAPLMEPKYIYALTPLGNINPPGHTSPVDHIYFSTDYEGQIPLFAPADAWITSITVLSTNDGSGNYIQNGYVISYTVCDGLVLDFAQYNDIIPDLKAEIEKQSRSNCVYEIVKPGHDNAGEGQCYYNLSYPVKAGEQIGYVQAEETEWGLSLPFEIWAANYNVPVRSDVNWDFYNDDRYAHSFCLFDLYSGDLKEQYDQKFGGDNRFKPADDPTPDFVPRTVEPICGQVNQDLPGTIQGMWYGGEPGGKGDGLEFQGKGLAFLHNNIDPTQAELSIGGNFTSQAGAFMFTPNHSGTIDREPAEVTADGQIYCYNADSWSVHGKILVQLLDDHHLKVENQTGLCTGSEIFKNPFDYQR